MTDIWHFWGQDLTVSPSGDLALVQSLNPNIPATLAGNDEGTQRIYRRLMTGDALGTSQSGEDIFNPAYGGGIPQKIGSIMDPVNWKAEIVSQMFNESAVAKTPRPQVTFAGQLPASAFVTIKYQNAQTGQPIALTFNPNGTD